MDTGEGILKMMSGKGDTVPEKMKDLAYQIQQAEKQYPNHGGTFYVGQNLELNGSKFRVLTITKKTITLRVLPNCGG
jgi:hypothetical protein